MKKIIIFIILSTSNVFAEINSLGNNKFEANNEYFILNEENIKKLVRSSPSKDAILLTLLNKKNNYLSMKENYSLSLDSRIKNENSNKGSNSINSSHYKENTFSVDLNKKSPYGIQYGIGYSIYENNDLNPTANINSKFVDTKLSASITIDLFKNFLGSTSFSELKDEELNFKAEEINMKISEKALTYTILSLYWDYIAAFEARKKAEEILNSSEKQLQIALNMQKNDVADDGDIARFKSQVNDRKTQILFYISQMKRIELELRQLFPELQNKTIKLDNYDEKRYTFLFNQCFDVIKNEEKTPNKFSMYDEIVALKKEQFKYKKKHLSNGSDIDLKFIGETGIIGTGDDKNLSNEDFSNEKNNFYSAELSLSIPIGNSKKKSKENKLLIAEKSHNQEIDTINAKTEAYHSTIKTFANYLKDQITLRSRNSNFLEKALEDSRKKYSQARITSQALLQEEDKLLSNSIQLIEAKKEFIRIVYDYLKVFTKTPCEINK